MSVKLSDIGVHFLVGLDGPEITASEKTALAKFSPAGLLLLAQNFDQEAPYETCISRLKRLYDDFRKAAGREKILIAIDHEGGRVNRLPAPLTLFPYPLIWGEKLPEIAKAMSVELLSLGIGLNLGPVLDIHSNPKNPVIGPRAFGRDPITVSAAAIKVHNIFKDCGILSCAKHFPGHGDTITDSHLELPALSHSLKDLEQRELVPFKELIAAGTDCVMSAHVLFKALDPKNPATLSKTILRELLRNKLCFKGIIISDSLVMQAVRDIFFEGAGAADGLEAGCDIYSICSDKEKNIAEKSLFLAEKMCEAMHSSKALSNAHCESIVRVTKLLARATQKTPKILAPKVLKTHAKLAASFKEKGSELQKTFSVALVPSHRA